MKIINILYLLTLIMTLGACATRAPKGTFDNDQHPKFVDYSLAENWASLPDKSDPSDLWAGGKLPNYVGDEVDVFYLYPTIYTGAKRYQTHWNAPTDLPEFNREVDESPIKYQASIFNGVGKIYAPRYRQAHIKCYFNHADTASVRKAFDLAYQDVRAAFVYYINHYNQGRPIILASHSQGTTHMVRLMKEFFETDITIKNKLVVAYILGMPVAKNQFKTIPLCENENQTGCFCAWRTFEKGYLPKKTIANIAVVNPLTWTTDSNYAPASLNKGAVFRDFSKIMPQSNDAQIYNDILWTNKPKFKGSFLLRTKNFHAGDFNIYYMNIRDNAKARVNAFWK
jgi:hypothetical protein